MASRPLHFLLVEDSAADAELSVRALRQAGFEFTWTRVETRADLGAALDRPYDVILSDYELPQWTGLEVLALVRARDRDVPFIIVSGTIGEERAVQAIQQGASDYLLKDRLARLGSAVHHALEQLHLRRARAAAEQAQRESEARFHQAVENIDAVLWLTTPGRGEIIYVSPAYARVWGRSVESLLAAPCSWLEAVLLEDRARVERSVRAEAVQGDYHETYRIRRGDGQVRWIRSRSFPVRDAAGRVVRVAGVSEDVTERRALEAQLLRAQRLEALGGLAGGVAHDLNNILAPVLMVSGLLRGSLAQTRDRELLELVEQGARRGALLVRQLLAYTRGTEGGPGGVRVHTVIAELGALLRETFPRDIELVIDVAPDVGPLEIDATPLHQVLMNLCVNARDAMPGGGTLTLQARPMRLPDDAPAQWTELSAGTYGMITVTDTGQGIPPEIIERIFDPFFTTKDPGKGTGLGLSTVLGLVRGRGGSLHVRSVVGVGTTFSLMLPTSRELPASASASPLPSDIPRGRGELILVVDDEVAIRESLRAALEHHGYRVVTAADGREAIKLYLRYQAEVQLVLSDLMMPVMSGLALIRALRACDSRLRIVAITGLDEHRDEAELRELGVTPTLVKPCSTGQLMVCVRTTLDATGAPLENPR